MSKSLYQTNVESRAPLTTDVGVVGNWWIDTSASPADLYLCTDATGGVYTWTKQGGGSGGGVQQDTTATSVATLFTALETLRTTGKTILSINFTPTTAYALNIKQMKATTLSSTPAFAVSTYNKTIFDTSPYTLTLSSYTNSTGTYDFYFNDRGSTAKSSMKLIIASTVAFLDIDGVEIGTDNFTLYDFYSSLSNINTYVTSYTINYI